MNENHWQPVFWAAAVFNFLVGLPSLLAAGAVGAATGQPPLDPQNLILAQMTGLLIAVFGVGYAMVALGKPGARQIVFLGLLGKVGVCVLVALRLQETALPTPMLWATAVDLLFVVAFAAYLLRRQNTPVTA